MNKLFLCIIIQFLYQISYSQWNGNISIGTSYFSGNVNQFSLRSEGQLVHNDTIYEFTGFYRVIYSENNNIKNNQELSGGLKYDWHPVHTWSPFIALTLYHNEFNGYNLRISSFAGLKYTFIFKKNIADYSLSAALQYDAEKYAIPKKVGEIKKSDTEKIRLSIRPKFIQNITNTLTLIHTTFFRPLISDFNDYQIDSQTYLNNKISDFFSINIKYEYIFDSRTPSSSLVNDNNALIIAIQFKF